MTHQRGSPAKAQWFVCDPWIPSRYNDSLRCLPMPGCLGATRFLLPNTCPTMLPAFVARCRKGALQFIVQRWWKWKDEKRMAKGYQERVVVDQRWMVWTAHALYNTSKSFKIIKSLQSTSLRSCLCMIRGQVAMISWRRPSRVLESWGRQAS